MRLPCQIAKVLVCVLGRVCAAQTSVGFYNPAMGRWLTRDPMSESGGLSLYAFVANDPLAWVDHLGLSCGAFIIREKPNIKVPDDQLQSSGGKEYLNGFDVQYTPCDACSCPKDKIRLVQAIKSNGGTGEGPHMDSSGSQRQANRNGTDTSFPTYSGYQGDEGPLSYQDSPNNPRKLYGETTFTMEVCAVCKDGRDRHQPDSIKGGACSLRCCVRLFYRRRNLRKPS